MDKVVLDLYTDYLVSSVGQVTATGLASLLDGSISHDRISRFLASEPFGSANLWRLVKPLVRQVQSEDAVLIIDDSVEAKPSPMKVNLSAGTLTTRSARASRASTS